MAVFTREQLEPLSKGELIEIILKLDARVTALEAQLREVHSAKAPFGKGKRKAHPKRPGRRAGEGKFSRRSKPVAGPGDVVQHLAASLAEDQRNCPECHTPLVTHHEEVTVEDMPERPRRVIKHVSVEVGKCPLCGFTARGHHPCMRTHQRGANAHQLEPVPEAFGGITSQGGGEFGWIKA